MMGGDTTAMLAYWKTAADPVVRQDLATLVRAGARPWTTLDTEDKASHAVGEICSYLSLALGRPTPVLWEAWIQHFPWEMHTQAWTAVLKTCHTDRQRVSEQMGSGRVNTRDILTPVSALAVAWRNPQPWAVKALVAWGKDNAVEWPEETWAKQVAQALEQQRQSSLPFSAHAPGTPWRTLQAIAPHWSGWPGDPLAWAAEETGVRHQDRTTWEAWALRRDDMALMESLMETGCGLSQPIPVSTVHLATLPAPMAETLHHLFARAIGERGPGALSVVSWFMQRTDILEQPPKGPALPHWNKPTWRAAIEARATDPQDTSARRVQAYHAALSLIRHQEAPDPPPRPRDRPRRRS